MGWSKLFQSTVFRLILGLGLFILVILILAGSFEADEVIQAVSAFPARALLTLAVCALLVNFLKASRFYVLVRHVRVPISFWRTVRVFFASLAATPLPAGEAIRATLLKQETGEPLGRVASPVLGQAVYEIAAAATIILMASFVYPVLLVPTLLTVVVLTILMFILTNRSTFQRLLKMLSKFNFIAHRADRVKNAQEHLRQNFSLLEEGGFDRHTVAAIALAALAQVAGGVLVLLAANAVGVQINFFESTLVYSSGAILQGVFTIIPAGLGVTEGGMSGILHLLGVELTVAIALVIIIRLATTLFPVALGMGVFGVFYAKRALFKVN